MALAPSLQFLGWAGNPLALAADALVERYGEGLGRVLVTVPGARVGRGLAGELRRAAAERGLRAWTPPRVLTQGRLVDELLELDRPTADRAARTFAWERALVETLGAGGAANDLFERVPPREDRVGWWRLAERVRALHAELADEGHDFAMLAAPTDGTTTEREVRRWAALAKVQKRWREQLDACGLADPHDARNAALAAEHIDRAHAIALVGIVDGPGLLRRALELRVTLGAPPDAFVLAPEREREGFDALGFLVTEHWRQRALHLAPSGAAPLSRWHVVRGPLDEAELAARIVAHRVGGAADPQGDLGARGGLGARGDLDARGGLGARGDLGARKDLDASDVTIGVADEAATPFLERRFAAEGVRARPAAGEPLERTPPARLLASFAAWLDGRAAATAAELLRHPDLERALDRRLQPAGPAPEAGLAADLASSLDETPEPRSIPALLDRVRIAHLPERLDVDSELPIGVHSEDRAPLLALFGHLRALAGALLEPRAMPLRAALEAARALLVEVYDGHALADEGEPARVTREALAAIGEALSALEHVPAPLAGEVTPSAALELLLHALRGRAVPPAPDAQDVPTIELLGWLELPFDPAPVLVVTGFVDGSVPTVPGADPFLPDSLRGRLGLEDDAHRTARDAYVAATLVATRSVDFVSPRRTREGEPRFPSRLAFHADPEEVLRRMQHALHPTPLATSATPAPRARSAAPYTRPTLRPRGVPSVFAVTDFAAYIESPYRYALERLLRLREVDDGARELDAASFGDLVHDALSVLSEPALATCTSEAKLHDAVLARLDGIAELKFGRAPLPAVAMQIEQARLRLIDFVPWQAQRALQGWEVVHTEWAPSERAVDGQMLRAVPLPMPRSQPAAWLRGKIDRVDRHRATGRIAIIDYKTGKRAKKPDDAYKATSRKKDAEREWVDPQLALYCLLASELLGSDERPPDLGYLSLTPDGSVWSPAPDTWHSGDVIGSAVELAVHIVSEVRAGALDALGNVRHFKGLAADLIGVGFVVAPEGDDDETLEGNTAGAASHGGEA